VLGGCFETEGVHEVVSGRDCCEWIAAVCFDYGLFEHFLNDLGTIDVLDGVWQTQLASCVRSPDVDELLVLVIKGSYSRVSGEDLEVLIAVSLLSKCNAVIASCEYLCDFKVHESKDQEGVRLERVLWHCVFLSQKRLRHVVW